ncbi:MULTISPECIES: hypothetical protein [Pseudanabaena]|uniref:Uncharacterized protein n=1 Tax=Pseudanabaena catenata USMAC16 TaxID=1855837 RepID=A0A9X4MDD8_9CYAN|nr:MULTISPECIES: hypothetical protein [Pseudanabaena]MDG3497554.1 hypothetical protein [Pseudanabaena catenata USMAC16]
MDFLQIDDHSPDIYNLFAMPSTTVLTTDTDWQDGHDGLDGLDSDIALICNNHLDISLILSF